MFQNVFVLLITLEVWHLHLSTLLANTKRGLSEFLVQADRPLVVAGLRPVRLVDLGEGLDEGVHGRVRLVHAAPVLPKALIKGKKQRNYVNA